MVFASTLFEACPWSLSACGSAPWRSRVCCCGIHPLNLPERCCSRAVGDGKMSEAWSGLPYCSKKVKKSTKTSKIRMVIVVDLDCNPL